MKKSNADKEKELENAFRRMHAQAAAHGALQTLEIIRSLCINSDKSDRAKIADILSFIEQSSAVFKKTLLRSERPS